MPSGSIELAQVSVGSAIPCTPGELRVDICAHASVTPHGGPFKKAPCWADGYPFKVNCARVQDLFIDALLLALDRLRELLIVDLHCSHGLGQSGNLRLRITHGRLSLAGL